MDRVLCYNGIYSLNCLRRAIYEVEPDIIIPCDDGVVAQLHALHREEPSFRGLIENSIGSPQSFPIVSSRFELSSTAKELRIAVPITAKVTSAQDLVTWHHEVPTGGVLKLDGGSGGTGVRICSSLAESLVAWHELSTPVSSLTAWKRLAIDRDPLSRWTHEREAAREITMQGFIAGRPANSMCACQSGEVLATVSVAVLAAEGPTGAAIIVQRVIDERLAGIAQRLVKRLRLTGFVGLDFMLEERTGTPHLIEMNPRCTQLGHLEFPEQGSLAGIFAAALRSEQRPPAKHPILHDKIAFFPQAIASQGPHSRQLEFAYLDVPWEEPKLMRELKLRPWPQRQWLARLYHAFRPPQRSRSVEFTSPEPMLRVQENLRSSAG